MNLNFVWVGLVSILITLVISPFIVKFLRKIKFGQNILHYVESHKTKQGTPSSGGIILLISTAAASFIFFRGEMTLALVALAAMSGFGLLGLLDDFLKIKNKTNLGLRAWQKVLGQMLISAALSVFIYLSPAVNAEVIIPFTHKTFSMGWLVIPFSIFVFIGATNSVNLTDGLDGLASNVSKYVLIALAVLMIILGLNNESSNLLIVIGASVGSLLAFSLVNTYPAKCFMGDCGSLALGALIASCFMLSKFTLYLPIIGVMFVVSAISVIMQVIYFKATKGKRIFLMAPYHHHLEKKGIHENRIVAIYSLITIVISVVVSAVCLIV